MTMAFAIVLAAVGLGLSCFLMFNLAIYALPVFIGFTAGYWAIHIGAGAIGGVAVGVIAGAMLLVTAKGVFAATRSPVLRRTLILIFAGPAAVVGYSAMMQFWSLAMAPSPYWQHIFAIISAIAISAMTMARISAPLPDSQRSISLSR